MTNREFVLETFAGFGARTARELQAAADLMSGTELYEQERFIPDFAAAIEHKNMLERDRGFVCRSSAGRIVRESPVRSTSRTSEESRENRGPCARRPSSSRTAKPSAHISPERPSVPKCTDGRAACGS